MRSLKSPLIFAAAVFMIMSVWPVILRAEGAADNAAAEESAPSRQLAALAPGAWAPVLETGASIYPSFVVATSTMKERLWDDDTCLGDGWGVIGVAVRAGSNHSPVTVEISGGAFIKPSVFKGELADKDTVYRVYPDLKYDYDKLLSVSQTVPEMVTFKVSIGGRRPEEKSLRVQVRCVNECVFYFQDSAGNAIDTSYIFAAYVNENHPFINLLLKEALRSGKVDSFAGYQGDRDDVLNEIGAVWDTLNNRGMHYTTMPASPDDDDPYIGSQYVKLLGESVNYAQANCVDGSVLIASILRKIGLNVSLVALPDHMFIAVDLDGEGKEAAYIETTMMGDSSLEDAMEDGRKEYEENRARLESDKPDDEDYGIINIQNARDMGVMPIKES